MKSIFIVLLFFILLNGKNLIIDKRIIPISLLQIDDIVSKKNKIINLIIVVNKSEIIKATKLKDILPKSIKSFKLNTNIVEEKDIDNILKSNKKIDAIYCFELTDNSWKSITNYSIKNHIVTYSYDKEGLKKGALLYIDITNKIHIFANRYIMQKAKVSFNNQFLQIVEIYDNK